VAALGKVLALLASLVVALAALWWLTRQERRRPPRALVAGYPESEFPRRELLHAALESLCASQASLLAMYARVPVSDPARASLLVFLEELRALLDGAHHLAEPPVSPAASARLERLAHDVHAAVREMIETTHGQTSSGHSSGELELRVEVMRALARDAGEM
jgi:hypothetical protein